MCGGWVTDKLRPRPSLLFASCDDCCLCQVSALCGGWVTDTIGRRPSLLVGSVLFSIGGVVMGAAPTKELLLVGRVVCGLGIGELDTRYCLLL